MLLIILFIITSILMVFYFYHTFSYWKRHNVPSYPSPSIITGHTKPKFIYQLNQFYRYFKEMGYKHGGFYLFHQPIYMPTDPELLKQIMTKDFEYFDEKGIYMNEKHQPITMHLFNIGGDRWKKLRVKLTPTFTSGKLKNMYPTIKDCTKPLIQCLEEHTLVNKTIDMKDVASKFTTDVIGSCAFGIECNSFKDNRSDFHQKGKELVSSLSANILKQSLAISFPKICKFFGLTLMERDLEDFYTNITKDTVKYRQDNNVERNDFLQLLLNLRSRENSNERVDMQEIINQSFVFYVAGFETSSTVMTYTLLELARNQEIQDKVRNEISQVMKKHNKEITYDAIQEMKYLGQVVDESLRMYPPLVILNRGCSKNYSIPGTDVILEKDTQIFIPVYAIHHDEEYYPVPHVFDPERFSDENCANRPSYTFLPFGEGPRMCIGLRFGYLQAKLGLATLLHRFKFTMHPSVKYPIKFEKGFVLLQSESKILLNSEPV